MTISKNTPLKSIKSRVSYKTPKSKSTTSRTVKKHNSTILKIYRKTISNLKIREDILRNSPSKYKIGPTLIWTEDANDLSIFTTAENYTNYIGFESQFANPKSPKYLKKILKKMKMTKGSILIKEATSPNEMHIPVHFCAYRIDKTGNLNIFDPSWHSEDPGIYSTTAFYDSLNAFGISCKHAESTRRHHWQSLLPNDVFCQTWTLQWLICDKYESRYPLPLTTVESATHIAKYIKKLTRIVLCNLKKYMSMFPKYKLEGNDPNTIFRSIISNHKLTKTIYDMF